MQECKNHKTGMQLSHLQKPAISFMQQNKRMPKAWIRLSSPSQQYFEDSLQRRLGMQMTQIQRP